MLGAIEYDYRTLTGWPTTTATPPPTLTQLVRGTDNQNSGASATTTLSIVLTAPAGIQAGDPVVVGIETREPSATLSTWRAPAGFTLIGNAQTTGDAFLYYGIYGQNGLTGTTFTFDNGAANATGSRWAASLVVLNGTYAGAYQTGALQAATGSATVSSPAITTTGPAYLVGMAGSRLNGGATWTWPSNWTEEGDTDPLAATNSAGHTSAVYTGAFPAPAGSYTVAPVASQAVVNGYAGVVAFTARTVTAGTPVVVQQVTGSAASSANFTTGAVTTTAGNVVALVVGRSGGLATGSITSVTDTTGNTWTKATTGSVSNGTNSRVELWYTTQDVGALTGGTITANSGTAQTNDYSIIELSGVNRSAPLTASSPDGSGATSATPQTPAVTAHANDLVLSVVHHTYNAAADTVSDSGWTLLTPSVNGTAHLTSAAYQVQSAAGTIGPTWARGGGTSSANGLITASFAAATGASAGGVTKVASVQTQNAGLADVSITVPAGVTTSHLGIITVVAANTGVAAMTVPTGWTARANPSAGQQTASSWIFTRLGGVAAGQTITMTMPSNNGAATTAVWYDTGGRDIAQVSTPWNTNAVDSTTVTWNAPGQPAATDVILVAATRTTTNTLPPPTGVTLDFYGVADTTYNCGAFFGHANGVTSQSYTSTWSPANAVSHNVEAIQFALAAPPPSVASPNGTITLPYQQDFTGNNGHAWPGEWTTATGPGLPTTTTVASDPFNGAAGPWTAQWTDLSTTGTSLTQSGSGYGSMISAAGNYSFLGVYNAGMTSAVTDCDAYITFWFSNQAEAYFNLSVSVPSATADTADTFFPQTGYSIQVTCNSAVASGAIGIYRQSANTSTAESTLTKSVSAGAWLNLHVRRSGGTVSAVVWPNGQAEPAFFDVSWTDPSPLAAGRTWLGASNGSGTGAETVYVYAYSVTTPSGAASSGVVDIQNNTGRLVSASGVNQIASKAYLAGLAPTSDFQIQFDVTIPVVRDSFLYFFFRTPDFTLGSSPSSAYLFILDPGASGAGWYSLYTATATAFTRIGSAPSFTYVAGTSYRVLITGMTQNGNYTLAYVLFDPAVTSNPAWAWTGIDNTVTTPGSIAIEAVPGGSGLATTFNIDNLIVTPVSGEVGAFSPTGIGSSTLTGFDSSTATVAGAGAGSATLGGPVIIQPPAALAPAATGSSSITAQVQPTGTLAASGVGTTTFGPIGIGTPVLGFGVGTSTLSATVNEFATVAGTGAGSSSLSGFKTTTATLAAAGTGTATVTGLSTVLGTLTATGAGTATVTVTHTVFATLAGTGAGNAVLSGQLAISGLLTPTGTGSSSLADPMPLTITGTLTAFAVGTSSLNTFASAGVGTMTLTGVNTTTGSPVPAVAVGSSTLSGLVTTTRTFTGTGIGTASLTIGVTEVGLLTPTGTGTATLSSGPGSIPASVAATGTGSATLSGFRSTTGTLSASGTGTEALAVTHTVTTTLAAAGVGTATIANVGLGTTVYPFGVGSSTLTGFESRTAVLAASGSGSMILPFDYSAGPADTLGATGTVTVTRTTPGTPADPASIASLYQRYVASDIAAAAGAAITSWAPRTGTGTLTGTGTYQTTGSLINGKPAVRFNGTSNTFTGTGLAGTTAATVVVVFATNSSAQQELVQISQCETIINSGDSLQLWSGVNLSSTATVSTGTPHVAAFGTNTSSANYIMLDGTQVASGNAGTPSTGTAIRIGTVGGSTRYLNGDVAEVLVFNTQLTAADLATVDSYVQATYGITTADSTPTGNVSTTGNADVSGLTDAATDVQGLVRAPADTEGITDAVSFVRTVFTTVADTEPATDAVAKGFGRTVADNEPLTDIGGKWMQPVIADTLGLSDAEAVYGVFNLPVTTTAEPDVETRVGLHDVVHLRGSADVTADVTGDLVKGPQRAVIDIETPGSDLTHVVALSGTAAVNTGFSKPRLRVVHRMSDVLTTQISGVVQTLVLKNGPIYGDPATTVFSDDFSAVRSDLWTYGPTTTVSGGQLVCPCNTSWTSTAVSKAAFDLTGATAQGQMLSIAGGVADGSGADSWFAIDDNPVSNNNGFNIDISEGQISPSYNIGGVFTFGPPTPYVAARHKWFRYRHAAGTVYWEVSADALSWTALWSWVPTFSITKMYVLLGNGASAPTAQQPTTYDNVSVVHTGGPAATGGVEPGVYGPTNKPVWKLSRNAGVLAGWGSYIAADVFDDIPAGATVTISLYVRGAVGEATSGVQIINDGATDTVANLPAFAPYDGVTWQHYTATVTLPKTWTAGVHRFRLGINNWVEWSDATLTVSMPLQVRGPVVEPQTEPVTDPPRKLDRVFVVLR